MDAPVSVVMTTYSGDNQSELRDCFTSLYPEAIASGISRVLRDEEFATQRRERGLERATQFSWDETASTIHDTIVEVSEN